MHNSEPPVECKVRIHQPSWFDIRCVLCNCWSLLLSSVLCVVCVIIVLQQQKRRILHMMNNVEECIILMLWLVSYLWLLNYKYYHYIYTYIIFSFTTSSVIYNLLPPKLCTIIQRVIKIAAALYSHCIFLIVKRSTYRKRNKQRYKSYHKPTTRWLLPSITTTEKNQQLWSASK